MGDMGPISDRSKERVGASDVAVVAFRRLMVDAARTMQQGGPAIGTTEPHIPHATISSYEGVVPKTTNWRSLGGGSEAPLERVRESRQITIKETLGRITMRKYRLARARALAR